ncbi:MAG: hypothetical protein ABIR81_04825, partial [Ginsengibacter sp.]
MKKMLLLLQVFVLMSITLYCQVNNDKKDTSTKKPNAAPDRNMFGHGIPRGLTKSSDGLSDGYIMFAVPNSASVYLLNRKGLVVHEWKSN